MPIRGSDQNSLLAGVVLPFEGTAQSIGLSHGFAIVIRLPVDQSRPRLLPVLELPLAGTLKLRVAEPLAGAAAGAVPGAEYL
jgi:hypothetical protein